MPKVPETEDAAKPSRRCCATGFHGKKSNPGSLLCQYGARSSTNSIAGPYYGESAQSSNSSKPGGLDNMFTALAAAKKSTRKASRCAKHSKF
ncbi:hypothetical protein CEXT_365971 [Caerostris extrusa]|uniref:Uncharacterized protein n=1 Tax=Caerostris extrusa TaxID=172846 RepID=A0AAV4TVC1_CAEEX|nr:hypothetical protein CEXT_365971 [Caerostris extrusa]